MSVVRCLVLALLVSAALLWKPALSQIDACSSSSVCSFSCKRGLLDLTPLSGHKDQARFIDVKESGLGLRKYSFSPCTSFSEGTGCVDTSVCQIPGFINRNSTIDVGRTQSATLTEDQANRRYTLTYTSKANGINRTTHVQLLCDVVDGVLTVVGEKPRLSGIYEMTLSSKYACLKAPTNSSTVPPVVTTAGGNATSEAPPTTEPPANTTTSHPNATSEAPMTTAPAANTTAHSNHTTEPPHHNTTSHSNVTTEPPSNTTTHPAMTTEPPSNTTSLSNTTHVQPATTEPGSITTVVIDTTERTTPATTPKTTPPGGLASTLRSSILTLVAVSTAASLLTTR